MGKIIHLYGLPACGKTTQADNVVRDYGFAQFGMGDRLRDEIKSGSDLGQEIKKYVDDGVLIPDELMMQIIENVGEQAKDSGIIFDGFPRMLSQAKMLEKIGAEHNLQTVAFFYLKISEAEVIKRITERAEIQGRADDKDPAVIQNRINEFKRESVPLLEYYKNNGLLVEIDGEMGKEKIYEEIKKYL